MARARTMKKLRDESGQTLVFVAFFMGLLALGFVAFALDVGALFREKRMAQSAAQAAAVAAAEEVGYGNTANEQAVANAMAKLNGFDTTLATQSGDGDADGADDGKLYGELCAGNGQNADPYDLSGRVRAWDGYGAGVRHGDRGGWDIQPDVRVRDWHSQCLGRLHIERKRLRDIQ